MRYVALAAHTRAPPNLIYVLNLESRQLQHCAHCHHINSSWQTPAPQKLFRSCSLTHHCHTNHHHPSNLSCSVNKPGFMYKKTATGVRADPCGIDTYTPGLAKQTQCTQCPPGFKTNPELVPGSQTSSEVCVAEPGYFVTGDSTAPCPQVCAHVHPRCSEPYVGFSL